LHRRRLRNTNKSQKGASVRRKVKSQTGIRRPRAIPAQRLDIKIISATDQPLYVQIRDQIRNYIVNSTLVPGMRLPPVRSLAQQLGVNPITVAKAFRELAEAKLVEGRRGGGSFIRAQSVMPATDHQSSGPLLAERLFELARAPGVVSFTSNYPVPDSKTIRAFRSALMEAVENALPNCFVYDSPIGRANLREQIRVVLQSEGITSTISNIMVTSGAQQAIDLSIRALLDPGKAIIIEQPAYYGTLNAVRALRLRVLEAPLEADGMNLNIVEDYLSRNESKVIYTNPTFQNPSGVTMSDGKRRALLALARRFGAVIIEDDHSHELRFSGKPVPAIRALAEPNDLVLYARGFGKTLLPGIRLGYLVMPDALRQRLLAARAYADLHSNSFAQEVLACFLSKGHHRGVIARVKQAYGVRQKRLYQRLVVGMPKGTVINKPDGGLSLWLTLPEGADSSELYFRAVRRGVAFVAGDVFYAAPSRSRSLRVSFGFNNDDEVDEGVRRLCSVVTDLLSPRSVHNLFTP
jgi:DNA-binding transcriptional MocR family regulator